MKQVSIQDFKRRFSEWLDKAASGPGLVITRHRQPLVQVTPIEVPHVHTGKRFGKSSIKPLFDNVLGGRLMELLADDRADEHPRRAR